MSREVEIVEAGTLIRLHDSELDRQIMTAKRFPRSTAVVSQSILQMATQSEDVAAACGYALPRGGKVIKGPSVRLAEICASMWGNARYATRIIEEGTQFVTAQAVFMDLEKNSYIQLEVQRRITKADGSRFDIDMIGVTSQAAMSIAFRNAVFKGIPEAVWGDAYAKAQAMVQGTIESLDARRGKALDEFKKLQVTDHMVLQLLNKPAVRDIDQNDLVVLRGVLTAFRDGEASVRTVFGNMESGKSKAKADVSGAVQRGRENAEAREKEREGNADQGRKEDAAPETESAGADTGPADGDQLGGVGREPGLDEGDGAGDTADDGSTGDVNKPIAAPVEGTHLFVSWSEVSARANLGDDWLGLLETLANELAGATDAKGGNAAWGRLSDKFGAAPEEVDRAAQDLRSAARKDFLKAGNARKASEGTTASSKLL